MRNNDQRYQLFVDQVKAKNPSTDWPREDIYDCSGLDLSYMVFKGLDLSYASFEGSDFRGAVFAECDLAGAEFMETNLVSTDFVVCDLTNACLKYCDLSNCSFEGSGIRGMNLNYTTMNWNSHELIAERLRQAAGDDPAKRMVAGLILISDDWCWSKLWSIRHPQRKWALSTMKSWIKEGDNAPELLERYRIRK